MERSPGLAAVLIMTLGFMSTSLAAGKTAATVKAVPGKYFLPMGSYDISELGYTAAEFFVAGQAQAYKFATPAGADGRWRTAPALSAPYLTRVVVARPVEQGKFNGTVVVEWLNVSGGLDVPVEWMAMHRELTRRGYAYVAVSAQKVGIDGGAAVPDAPSMPLKKINPQRYAELNHPGDAYAFDIFSQIARLVRKPDRSGLLPGLTIKHVLAVGESQSAAFLVTYVNAVDPTAKAYDGILIHSRFGAAAPLDGTSMFAPLPPDIPATAHLRPDTRVPVLTVVTETDLLGIKSARLNRPGYAAVRQPDSKLARTWEIAGTAHADNHNFIVSMIDTGKLPAAQLAKAWQPTQTTPAGKFDKPINDNPAHHYVVMAALDSLNRWVNSGTVPVRGSPVTLEAGSSDTAQRDQHGNVLGGIRTPWVDVPVSTLSGAGNGGNGAAVLAGTTEPFSAQVLAQLYPGGRDEYLSKFTAALNKTVQAGFILPDDRDEILQLAAQAEGP